VKAVSLNPSIFAPIKIMKLHKEGTQTLLLGAVVLAGIPLTIHHYLGEGIVFYIFSGLCALTYFLLLNFFRIPDKNLIQDEGKIIAPCDGKVVVIEEVFEPEYFKERRRQISIFMSPLNVHNNVNGISGIVSYFKYHPGKYLFAWHPKSSTENERTSYAIKNINSGREILMRQIAGALARRICWYVKPGDSVMQGHEFGFIKFGSRVDVFIPLEAKVEVQLDQLTVGGETIIASW
jgi:phosphatidylserine decarboxylase